MRRFLLVASAFFMFSVPLFAHSFMYAGKGAWKDSNGSGGHYDIQVSKKYMGNGMVKISTHIDFGDRDMSWTFFGQHKEHDLFDVLDSDQVKIGTGYCFEKSHHTHICHMDVQVGDVKIEKTMHIEKNHCKSMGSKTLPDGTKVMWMDALERVHS